MIIGLCGKSGSGKSTIARIITGTKQNAEHYDIDKIGHKVMTIKEVEGKAIKCFGDQIMTGEKIDRKKLAELVFNSRDEMNKLSTITWEYMQIEIDSMFQNSDNKIIVLDWILLSKTHYFDMCDIKILVDTPYEIRKIRAIQRDNITSEEFDLREQASIEYDNSAFDIIINNSNIEEIRKLVKQI